MPNSQRFVRHVRRRDDGIDVAADIDVVVATGTPGTTTRATNRQRVVVDQRRSTVRDRKEEKA